MAGDISFEEMRYRVSNDADFANRLVAFLESIITNIVESATADYESLLFENIVQYLILPDQQMTGFQDHQDHPSVPRPWNPTCTINQA
jgi:hypothetical protein